MKKMKAILKFNLDDPDDNQTHLRCIKSKEMALVIWEFLYNARKRIKEKLDMDTDPDCNDTLDYVFQEFGNLLEEKGIFIDELTD
jgi:hypothetical protein